MGRLEEEALIVTDPAAAAVERMLTTMTAPASSMTADEARAATDQILTNAASIWQLLEAVHRRKGYKALGYPSFADYVRVELDLSRARGYQLLDQGEVVRAITAAAGVSTLVDISERDARLLKPDLDAVAAEVERQVSVFGVAVEDAVADATASARARQSTNASKFAKALETAQAKHDSKAAALEDSPGAIGATDKQQQSKWDRFEEARRYKVNVESQPERTVKVSNLQVAPMSAPREQPRRNPLPDRMHHACFELRKAVERMQRIQADDRFPRQKDHHDNWRRAIAHAGSELADLLMDISEGEPTAEGAP